LDVGIQTKTPYFGAKVQTKTVKIRGESADVGSQTKIPYFDATVQTETIKTLPKHNNSSEEDNKQSLLPHSQEKQEARLEQAVVTRGVDSDPRLESHIYDDQEPEMATSDRGLNRSEVEEFSIHPRLSLSP